MTDTMEGRHHMVPNPEQLTGEPQVGRILRKTNLINRKPGISRRFLITPIRRPIQIRITHLVIENQRLGDPGRLKMRKYEKSSSNRHKKR